MMTAGEQRVAELEARVRGPGARAGGGQRRALPSRSAETPPWHLDDGTRFVRLHLEFVLTGGARFRFSFDAAVPKRAQIVCACLDARIDVWRVTTDDDLYSPSIVFAVPTWAATPGLAHAEMKRLRRDPVGQKALLALRGIVGKEFYADE
jgi:hypothetical protein